MLDPRFSDLSFRVLLRESSRRRNEVLDEFREWVAGFLAIALILAIPLYSMITGSDVSLVEVSEAAEANTGAGMFEAPLVNPDAVLNRLETNLLSRSDVRIVQAQLRRKGFDPGPIDGIAGRRTLSALNAYRRSVRLLPAQVVSRETADALQDQ